MKGQRTFDLVILDGHHLRTNIAADPWDIDKLLIAQLIIALESVRHGGTIVIKLTYIERVISAQILYMLDVLSRNVFTMKPRTMHAKRASFYAVAYGFADEEGAEESLKQVVIGMRNLWCELTFGGEEGRGRFLCEGDLDFLVTAQELRCGQDGYLDRLVTLGRNVWLVQVIGLNSLMRKGKQRCG